MNYMQAAHLHTDTHTHTHTHRHTHPLHAPLTPTHSGVRHHPASATLSLWFGTPMGDGGDSGGGGGVKDQPDVMNTSRLSE